LLLQSQP